MSNAATKVISMIRIMFKTLFLFVVLMLNGSSVFAEEPGSYVKLPLGDYNQIVEQAKNRPENQRPVPSTYALGKAEVVVSVAEDNAAQSKRFGRVKVRLTVKVLENQWTLVPVLPIGTSVKSASLEGSYEEEVAELMPSPQGLAWATAEAGTHVLQLEYDVDVIRGNGGNSLQIPLPQASSTNLTMALTAAAKNIAVIPAAGVNFKPLGQLIEVSATIPASSGVQVSWTDTTEGGYSMSRAAYRGTAGEKSVSWTADIALEVFGDTEVIVPLLPDHVTLRDIRVDQKPATILLVKDSEGVEHFATKLQGQGVHSIAFDIESAIDKAQGPLQTTLSIPAIPVSQIALTLDGKKDVTVLPASAVSTDVQADTTRATVFVPMVEEVTLAWTEAVPEELKEEIRTNVTIYHVAFAEENVLNAQARAEIEVTRGETNLIQIELPKGVQMNQVSSKSGGIADWRVEVGEGVDDLLNVYLDRKLSGAMVLELSYDTSIVGKSLEDRFAIPLLRMRNVHRQRGMLALLASKELTFKSIEEKDLSRVGENQLPAEIRQSIDKTVALSYKYAEAEPTLIVQLATPEKSDGRFDANINTLISLSDVTLKGSASVDLHVKSGAISELLIEIPAQVNILSLSAPSLRTHRVTPEADSQLVKVEFTQEMEGDFRVDIAYERILGDTELGVAVPTLKVRKAEVEQGRIAVEALSAVEVLPEAAEQLSAIEPIELPQQLVLKTTNPILLAYKYAHVSPPYKLALKVRRHKQIEVQTASIDEAVYRTLYTRDGLAVTSARFSMRNSREQFLRLRLPEGARIWHAVVDGRAEKPALADEPESESAKSSAKHVLIKIINSAQPFVVDLIYQSPATKMSRLGVVEGALPKPELIVTKTNWEVYLPSELKYGRVRTNMTTQVEGVVLQSGQINQRFDEFGSKNDRSVVLPPQIDVPLEGVSFTFTKLYANQGAEDAFFAVPYTSSSGAYLGQLLALGGVGLLCLAISLAQRKRRQAVFAAIGGAALTGLVLGYYGIDHRPSLTLAIAIILVVSIGKGLQVRKGRAGSIE